MLECYKIPGSKLLVDLVFGMKSHEKAASAVDR